MKYHPLREAVKITGLCANTLRKYADEGRIPAVKTPFGQRLFDLSGFDPKPTATVLYARVSSRKQSDDLDRQVAMLKEKYPQCEVVQDIASGLNFKRKGLASVLERAMSGEQLTLVVAHRDRLARFGFDLIKRIIERSGGQILVLHKSLHCSPTQELTEDLLAILSVFAARMHGLRKYKSKIEKDQNLSQPETEN